MSSHPEGEQLLRYADGELAARTAGKIRSHLEACWQCRTELEELQSTVVECVRYRKNVLATHLPPPPAPWVDIHRRFTEIDASLERARFFDRLRQVLQFPLRSATRWIPVAVALLVIGVLFQQLRLTPSVQAAELLRKAMVVADAHPAKARRIRIRTRQHTLTRVVGTPVATAPLLSRLGTPEASRPGNTDPLSSLQGLFRTAHYNWDDPLSARSYQAWREQLADKRDDVMAVSDCYRIRTSTASGHLREATLKLRMRDFRPVEGRFEFLNQEWVEISELPEEAPSTAAVVAKVAPRPARIVLPAPAATLGDELHVLAALHQVGADLGDPIEISRSGGQVLVTGVGIDARRRQEIHDALGSQKNVVVRFSEPAPETVQPEKESPADSSVSSAMLRLQARLEQQLGGRASFEQLAAQILDMSDAMMSRAYALRRLAERFPREEELGAQDRQLLRDLRHGHAATLAQQAAEMERVLKPVLLSAGGSEGPVPSGGASVAGLFDAARRVETLLASVFGVAPGEVQGDQLPSRLLSSLAQLRAGAETYDHGQKE